MLAAHQPLELGNAGVCPHERGALVIVCRKRFEFARAWLGPGLPVQSIWPIGLPGLDPVMETLAGDSKFASHGEHTFAPLDPLDRLDFVSCRKLTLLSSSCHRSSLKCLSL
ncbi:hypothetical protein A1D31_24420 [Bradyrhizobium liaoningense]|nr:hypothetical protein A1D31_24420 [Bradyrhizobium liaoningense]